MKQTNLLQENSKMPIIRIAPVCDGKIYVVPRVMEGEESPRMDLPIVERVEHVSTQSDKAARRVTMKYRQHLHTDALPRFCVTHRSASSDAKTIYLHVLPLRNKDEIHFLGGEWVSEEDIDTRPETFSPDLQTESGLLGMAAELWADFYL